MAVLWLYVWDTELNMACLGYQVENVRTLFMEITRASQRGEQVASEMSKEIMSKWSTFVSVGADKGGIYTCLKKTSWRPLGWNLSGSPAKSGPLDFGTKNNLPHFCPGLAHIYKSIDMFGTYL